MKYVYSIALLLCLSSCSMINSDIFSFSKKTQQTPQAHTQKCTLSDNSSSQISADDVVEFGNLQNQVISCHPFTD